MANNGLLNRLGIVRIVFRKDILYFFIPFVIVLSIALYFCVRDGLIGFWGTIWDLIRQPQSLPDTPIWKTAGLVIFITGFVVIMVGHITLLRNYSSFLVIHKNHQLITHGIYRFVRNPIYLGTFVACIGLAVYSASLWGFLTSLVLIPIFLVRIRLEEGLLEEEFQDLFGEYKKNTKRLIPFIY
jgi:steroid 5-alpha reductase family enzyme